MPRALWNGVVIAESAHTEIVEGNYYFPPGSLRQEFFRRPQARPMGMGQLLNARRKDGTQFPVEIGLNPIETEDGTWVLSSITDITDRRRAEEERQKFTSTPPGCVWSAWLSSKKLAGSRFRTTFSRKTGRSFSTNSSRVYCVTAMAGLKFASDTSELAKRSGCCTTSSTSATSQAPPSAGPRSA